MIRDDYGTSRVRLKIQMGGYEVTPEKSDLACRIQEEEELDNLPPKVGSASSAHLRRVNNPKKRKRQVEGTGIHHTHYRGTRNAGTGEAEIADIQGRDRVSQSFRHFASDGRRLDISNPFQQRGRNWSPYAIGVFQNRCPRLTDICSFRPRVRVTDGSGAAMRCREDIGPVSGRYPVGIGQVSVSPLKPFPEKAKVIAHLSINIANLIEGAKSRFCTFFSVSLRLS